MKQIVSRIPPEWLRIIGVFLLAAAIAVAAVVYYSVSPSPSPRSFFGTIPPDGKLPSGAQCAKLVRASPSSENRPENQSFNHATGQSVGAGFFPSGDMPRVAALAPLISGNFTGTTEEILRWAACKWGISQDVVFAQAAVESWWQQDKLGDWVADDKYCPPGHDLGADGTPGECPQSYGIVQNKYIFEKLSWPGIGRSTAMNVDAAYAIWRSCYNGDEIWLNNEPHGRHYHAGDLWGCIGRWFSGAWYTPAADGYIHQVQSYLNESIWTQPVFERTG